MVRSWPAIKPLIGAELANKLATSQRRFYNSIMLIVLAVSLASAATGLIYFPSLASCLLACQSKWPPSNPEMDRLLATKSSFGRRRHYHHHHHLHEPAANANAIAARSSSNKQASEIDRTRAEAEMLMQQQHCSFWLIIIMIFIV